ncbi:MAG: hypothetical protein HY348_07930 [Nitrospira defluvii]|nr:hypothetical protein [Nitrospira defluvii]
MDVTHIPCGQDGWAHLAAVIDCHDREVIGWQPIQPGCPQQHCWVERFIVARTDDRHTDDGSITVQRGKDPCASEQPVCRTTRWKRKKIVWKKTI